LQNFVVGLLRRPFDDTAARCNNRSPDGRLPWPAKRAGSALLRHRLVVIRHMMMVVVMMLHRMMLHHMMVVADVMAVMMLDHHDLLRRRRLGGAGREHRRGKSHRHGKADSGKEFRLHGMSSPRVNEAAKAQRFQICRFSVSSIFPQCRVL
jgi:hypothetical protein